MRRLFPSLLLLPLALVACGSSDVGTPRISSIDLPSPSRPGAPDAQEPPTPERDEPQDRDESSDVPVGPDVEPADLATSEVATPDVVPPETQADDLFTQDITPFEVMTPDDGIQMPEADVAPLDCEPGQTRSIACGMNGTGALTEGCAEGIWQDKGPCSDPDVCVNGNGQQQLCGLNGRGIRIDSCAGGQWQKGACNDPDVCKDGTSQTAPCAGGNGNQGQSCVTGQWLVTAACTQPGRWTCKNNTCTPLFGASGCRDGQCEPMKGESNRSCPADCDFKGTPGQDQPCGNALDCAFYDWPAGVIGYWECAGWPWDRRCNVVEDGTYCGTQGQDYCYMDTQYLETPQSCPADCPGKSMDCGSGADCILHDWPAS